RTPAAVALKGAVKRAIGPTRTRALKTRLGRGGAGATASARPLGGAAHRPRPALPTRVERPGINLIGYLSAETGMGEAARGLLRALRAADIPCAARDVDLNVLARRGDARFVDRVQADTPLPYDVNLLVANADQVLPLHDHLGPEVFGGRLSVGLWLWELERFPDRYLPAFDVLHEVWTPSTFCLDAIAAESPIPVRRVPLPIEMPDAPAHDRAHFELPDDAFVFLFLFNFLSYRARKNPDGLIEAFRRAFAAGDPTPADGPTPLLLIKTSHADFAPEALLALRAAADGANVRIVDGYADRDAIDSLMAHCDAYVSLHRSEGFGLTVAEAMALGKPVVATAYAGVTDFFHAGNGFPVRHSLVTLRDDEGPYPAGARWAEPQIDDAARQMRRIYGDPATARARGGLAQADIIQQLSPAAVGALLRRRLDALLRRVERGQLGAAL
ncbi:MAG: glycosyltransferase, partial [Acidobacteriota bacterium]